MREHDEQSPGETPGQALERARRHARAAAAESVAALEALLDAASLAVAGAPGGATAVAPLAGALAELRRLLAEPDALPGEALARALLEALEGEIQRWEQRGSEDPEARAVLRAFLGMREILWELGLRAPRQGSPTPDGPAPAEARRKPRKTRLQRVRVEG